MLSYTFLIWLVLGGLIGFVSIWMEGLASSRRLGELGTSVTPVILVSSVVSGLLGYYYMTSVNPFLLGPYLQALVVYGVAFGMTGWRAGWKIPFSGPWKALAACGVFLVLSLATSLPILHPDRYAALMTPEIKERDATVPLVDQSQARTVTDGLASKRDAEILASAKEVGLGSRVVIGAQWGHKVNGTSYWLAPLEQAGFWKYLYNPTTPGFIAVAQTNEMDTKFVQDKPMRIGVEAWGDDNVYRHLYNLGYANYSLGDAIFDADGDWHPYWVVPMSQPTVGFGAKQPVKWAIIDAVTGDTKVYDRVADVPAWVDRLYDMNQIVNFFDKWGCWSNGWTACELSGNNVLESTAGINATLDAHEDIVFYSGTHFENNQSLGATSGFYIANARTGKVTFYRRDGITEEVAKAVMDGAWANFKDYTADDIVLLTLDQEPTYFSVMTDANGSRKGFSLVLLTNRNVVGKGTSIEEALTSFQQALRRSNRDAGFDAGAASTKDVAFTGQIVTIMPYVMGGNTSVYITLNTVPGKIFAVSEEKIGEIVATKVGDMVTVTTDNPAPGIVFTTSFDNIGLVLKDETAPAAPTAAK